MATSTRSNQQPTDKTPSVSKMELPRHIRDYINLQKVTKRERIKVVECDSGLVENVVSNYIIVKEMLNNLSWQDRALCEHVCRMWRSAAKTLAREQLGPVDFVFEIPSNVITEVKFKKSKNFGTEPLAVFMFGQTPTPYIKCLCKNIIGNECVCENKHLLVDVAHHLMCAPKDCMLTVKAAYLSYLPLPQSPTYKNTITLQTFTNQAKPFLGGVYIPCIPNVSYQTITMTTGCDTKKDFYDKVTELAKTRIIKGAIVYVSDQYLMQPVEDIVFLNYIKEIQPDIPYAFGGCLIEDVLSSEKDIFVNICLPSGDEDDNFTSNLVTIGLFTVPKQVDETAEKYNFEMFSLVIESSDWAKATIEKTINEFSNKIPHFEHSVALKLSCVGRDKKHTQEQNLFRAAFPDTPLVGCYGNGELGLNHPERVMADPAPKRHRHDSGPQFGIMYSYSTVFVYIGWGKITKPAGN